jgi:hypothetical protein
MAITRRVVVESTRYTGPITIVVHDDAAGAVAELYGDGLGVGAGFHGNFGRHGRIFQLLAHSPRLPADARLLSMSLHTPLPARR